ncbi:MAG: GatB/YqeY domain-containing protein [Magnetococcales bacterium]|nr:GatB/YqeY domain-containing protein [Magnetococcales bacterium]
MDLRQRITQDLKEAMKAQDAERLSAIRMLRAALLNLDKSGQTDTGEAAMYGVIRTLIKQRRESVAAFRQAGREEQAEREEREASLLESYLPQMMAADDLAALVKQVISASGANSPKDMGRVMKILKDRVAGRADLGQISALVKTALSGS